MTRRRLETTPRHPRGVINPGRPEAGRVRLATAGVNEPPGTCLRCIASPASPSSKAAPIPRAAARPGSWNAATSESPARSAAMAKVSRMYRRPEASCSACPLRCRRSWAPRRCVGPSGTSPEPLRAIDDCRAIAIRSSTAATVRFTPTRPSGDGAPAWLGHGHSGHVHAGPSPGTGRVPPSGFNG